MNIYAQLLQQIDRLIAQYSIGVYFLNPNRQITWVNDFLIKLVGESTKLLNATSDIIFQFSNRDLYHDHLGQVYKYHEFLTVVSPWQFPQKQRNLYRSIFIPLTSSKDELDQVICLLLPLGAIEQQYFKQREFDSRIAELASSSAEAILSVDRDGKIGFWNAGAEQIFGYTQKEAIGKTVDFLLPQHLLEAGELEWLQRETAKLGAIVNHETQGITKEGKIFAAEVTNTILKDRDDRIIGSSAIIKDISQRKLLEDNLKQTIDELSKINAISDYLHSTKDLKEVLQVILTGVTAGQGFQFNRAFLVLLNKKRHVLEGTLAVGPSTPEEAGRIWHYVEQFEHLEQLLEDVQVRLQDTDNLTQRLCLGLKVSVEDVNHPFIRTLKQRQPMVIASSESQLSESAKLLQYLQTDVCVLLPLIGREDDIGILIIDNNITHKRISPNEIRVLHLFASQAALAVENARLYQTLENHIEELRRAYVNLEKSQERLMKAERLAAIGEIAAKVAHEIRNPLVAIGGFARILNRDLKQNKKSKEALNIITSEVQRLEHILEQIMTFVKPPHICEKQPANINNVLHRVLSVMDKSLQKSTIRLKLELEDNMPSVILNKSAIDQVFMNIMTNAVQSMHEHGRLTIRTEERDGHVQIIFKDTGKGIPPDEIKKIFLPFYTTRESGTGLGMTISKQILEEHQCHYTIQSVVNQGTVFTIRFPLPGESVSEL